MVRINGMEKDVSNMSLKEYLLTTDYNLTRIAVERNGNIVPKSQYYLTILNDGDTIEIVSFVGGG